MVDTLSSTDFKYFTLLSMKALALMFFSEYSTVSMTYPSSSSTVPFETGTSIEAPFGAYFLMHD